MRQVNRRLSVLPIVVFASIGASYTQAQSASSFVVGAFDVTPSLNIDVSRDDNLYQSDTNQVETTITTVTPAIAAVYDNGVSGVSLNYELIDGDHSSRESENFRDHRFDFATGFLFGRGVHRLDFSYSKLESHNRRGPDSPSGAPTDVNNVTTDLDQFEDDSYELGYTLGAEESPLRLELVAGFVERRFTTNRVTTASFDVDEEQLTASLIWTVSPIIRWTLDLSDRSFEYLNDATRDSDEQQASISLSWDITGSLTTDLTVGQVYKDFTTNDETVDYWDADLDWAIYSYSTLSLGTSQFVEETRATQLDGTGRVPAGDFTVRKSVDIGWTHRWTDIFQTELSYSESDADFSGGNREDEVETIQVAVDYQFRRWMNISFSAQDVKSRSVGSTDYDQNVYGVNVELTF